MAIGFTNSEQPFTEGLVGDSLRLAANIDAEKVKDEWEDAEGAIDHGRVINDDVLAPLKDQIDRGNKALGRHNVDNRSIIARSRNSIMQFPVYITQTIRVNEAHIISKLFERVYASLFQSILASNPTIEEKEVNELVFLKRFHTNLKESTEFELYNEFYTPIDTLDEIMKESVFLHEKISPTMEVFFQAVPYRDHFFESEANRMMCESLSGLSYLKEAETTTTDNGSQSVTKETVSDKELTELAIDELGLGSEAKRILNASEKDLEDYEKDQRNKLQTRVDNKLGEIKRNIRDGKMKGYGHDGGRYYREKRTKTQTKITQTKEVSEKNKDLDIVRAVDAPKLLKDADIKKINGMLPYTIEATFRVRPEGGGTPYEVHFIIGIKTVLHLIRSQDLMDDLRELVTGNIKSLQKVRYKTGEITFADYIFNKKGVKADAAKSINYNKKWMSTLKKLAEWDKTQGAAINDVNKLINGGTPIPNGTMVLSQTDVTTMMNQTGIDLSVVSNAKRLARSLFLIAVCIVDSSAGTMRVLFTDSDTDWDVQSLGAIDSELSKTDNSQLMRELNRMVNH